MKRIHSPISSSSLSLLFTSGVYFLFLSVAYNLYATPVILASSSSLYFHSYNDERVATIQNEIKQAIQKGNLSKARSLSHEWLMQATTTTTTTLGARDDDDFTKRKKQVSQFYRDRIDDSFSQDEEEEDGDGGGKDLFLEKVANALMQEQPHDSLVKELLYSYSHDDDNDVTYNHFRHATRGEEKSNISLDRISDTWDKCCSMLLLPSTTKQGGEGNSSFDVDNNNQGGLLFANGGGDAFIHQNEKKKEEEEILCYDFTCDFGIHSFSYLRLPVLNELFVKIVLPAVVEEDDDYVGDHCDASNTHTNTGNNHDNKDTNHEKLNVGSDDDDDDDDIAIANDKNSDDGFNLVPKKHTTTKDHHEQDKNKNILYLEQDGYLRLYNPSTVLWPAGYLLSLCLSLPTKCGIQTELLDATSFYGERKNVPRKEERVLMKKYNGYSPFAVELGAGVGAPSISLARWIKTNILTSLYGRVDNDKTKKEIQVVEEDDDDLVLSSSPLVVATDKSPHGLALTIANAYHNGVGNDISVVKSNHSELESVIQLRNSFFGSSSSSSSLPSSIITNKERIVEDQSEAMGGFAIVLGSSLPDLFYSSSISGDSLLLWNILDSLLDPKNPNAIAIFAHTSESPIRIPPQEGRFECIKQISGIVFGMRTIYKQNRSDFEISVFRRRRE